MILDNFFLYGPVPLVAMKGAYVYPLVLLSYIIASFGAYTGLRLAVEIGKAKTPALKNILHFGGAAAMGAGIWSMHFIGMLAFRMDMEMSYDPYLTALSIIIAIVIAYGALWVTRARNLRLLPLGLGAVLLGAAICLMHYTGMTAMHMQQMQMLYIPSLFAVSVAIAVAASGAALGIIFFLGRSENKRKNFWMVAAALVMGVAICGMHYTGMAAAVFIPLSDICNTDGTTGPLPGTVPHEFDTLALWIAGATSMILAIALALTVYKKEKNNETNATYQDAFPARVLLAALMLTLVSAAWGGVNSYSTYQTINSDIRKSMEIDEFTTKILHLENTLSNAAQMAAATGAPEWKQRYEEHEKLLNEALATLKKDYPDPDEDNEESGFVYNTLGANKKLSAMEHQSFELIAIGNLQGAKEVLHSVEYIQNKEKYAHGMREFTQEINTASHHKLFAFATRLLHALFPTIAAGVVLPVLWFFAVRSLRRWREEMTEARRQATEARNAAEHASAAKSEFLANMSHEIRTPMNSILGMTKLMLEDRDIQGEQRELLQIVDRSATSLLDIVNDILDLSKIEAKGLVLEKIPFDLKEVTASVLETLAPIASGKGVNLSCLYVTDDIPHLMGDPVRVSRIMMNLIGNGIKYTERGSVSIEIGHSVTPAGGIEITGKVIDTGIGIPEEKLDLIFEKFSQTDSSISRKYGGTGLGLTITRELVEMMGGTVSVRSRLGRGSAFTFRIPFDRAEESAHAIRAHKETRAVTFEKNRVPAGKAKILIAEDHPLNQVFIRKLLDRMGIANYELAEDGQQALEALEKKTYDIVLMDCHMPQKSGYDATRAIREEEKKTGNHVPVIAMTANAMAGEREKCLENGMDEYISKPIDADELKTVLSRWVAFDGDKTGAARKEAVPGLIDLSLLRTFSDGDRKKEQFFLSLFISESEKSIRLMEENCAGGENKTWCETAHKLKGGSANIGASTLRAMCAEAQGMRDSTMEARLAMLQRIKAGFGDIKTYLSGAQLL